MGVIGLWGLLEPAGKPIPLESLENKVLAVDVSIWLNQAVKGYRDRTGNAVTNAHLLGLFNRICKLLFYKIKPVFVFDGKAPDLKKETLHRRRIRKGDASKKSRLASAKILDNYVRRQAVAAQLKRQTHAVNQILEQGQEGLSQILKERTAKKGEKDLFDLPPLPKEAEDVLDESESDDSDEDALHNEVLRQLNVADINEMNVKSEEFLALPKETQYEMLTELTERRKQSSWGRMHEMPKDQTGFSGFQMDRLLKRSQVQKKLDNVGKEIGAANALVMDSNLFVGDREGLKKAKAQAKQVMSSKTGDHVLFISGLKDVQAGPSTSNDVEVRDDDSEVIAQSIAADDKLSQAEIMETIKSQTEGKSKSLSDSEEEKLADGSDSDNEIEILEPTVFRNSKRAGGVRIDMIKKEAVEVSSSSSDDDMFEDVFDSANAEALDAILKKAASNNTEEKPVVQICLDPIVRPKATEAKDDLFAGCFEEKQIPKNQEHPSADDLFADVFEEKTDKPGLEGKPVPDVIADSMKKSDQLWLKKAYRYMEADTQKDAEKSSRKETRLEKSKSNESKDCEQPSSSNHDDMDKLVAEMKAKEREQRLLNIKKLDNLDKLQADENNKKSNKTVSTKDAQILDNLGVSRMAQEDYQARVQVEEGLADEKNNDELEGDNNVYGDSVSGFVRSSNDASISVQPTTILEEDIPNETLEKLNNDDEESDLTTEELMTLQNKLASEQDGLIAERGTQERLAATITDQMYQECQELLQLFGLPWIVAPSEAEAQCAFLDMIGLSNGTITDDSDVWVFGGQRVYKNFFNQDRHCEYFSAADVAKHFGLSRDKLINLALMTGSDYTDGIESVGPVSALEILAEFPGQDIDPLLKFKAWWDIAHKDYNMTPGSKLREKLRKLKLPVNFPSTRIVQAYLNPEVDNSNEKFSWAIPNFVAIRDYASEKFGWSRHKIDEIIKPVIKQLSTRISQERIDNYFLTHRLALSDKGQYQSSKRVQQAIGKVLGKTTDEGQPSKPSKPKKRKVAAAAKTKVQEPKAKSGRKSQEVKASTSQETDLQPIVVLPPKDWKAEDKRKQEEAKKRAAEILRKSKAKTKAKKAAVKSTIQRKVLTQHNLSESDSD